MGIFSLALRMSKIARKVVCTDRDEAAIEYAYNLFKKRPEDCTAAIIDFLEENRSIKVPSVAERYRADVVVALALTHHLILSHGVGVTLLMRRIAAFCTRYAVVEFMPLGLWDGHSAPPVPAWYSLDWFRRHFLMHFDLLCEEKLGDNRILLVGRKRELIE